MLDNIIPRHSDFHKNTIITEDLKKIIELLSVLKIDQDNVLREIKILNNKIKNLEKYLNFNDSEIKDTSYLKRY